MLFYVDYAQMLRQHSGFLHDQLTGLTEALGDHLRPGALNAIVEQHCCGQADHTELLCALLTYALWLRLPGVTVTFGAD